MCYIILEINFNTIMSLEIEWMYFLGEFTDTLIIFTN